MDIVYSRYRLLKVWSLGGKPERVLGADEKCRVTEPAPAAWIRICILTRSPGVSPALPTSINTDLGRSALSDVVVTSRMWPLKLIKIK